MADRLRRVRLEMPFQASDPSLVRADLGITLARRRAGRHSFRSEQTVLDTPDHRLLRARITLAHRVVDGLGEWFLDAPTWAPWLPAGAMLQHGAADDLPQEFASLVRPFRRRAPLGPVAAVVTERGEWQLLDAEEMVVLTLRDERAAIRRGGVTTARFRELTVRPEPGCTPAQLNHVVEALLAAGGSPVEHFPRLAERIGAPATGLSDFRAPFDLDEGASLEKFTRWLFTRRLDAILRADLEQRSGRSDDMDPLRAELAELRREVRSLAFALEPAWREELEGNLGLVLDGLARRTVHQLGEDYLAVLDALVQAIRAPKLGDLSHQRACDVLAQQTSAGTTILLDRARSLTLGSPDDRWQAALASARQMATMARTDRLLFGKQAKRMEKALVDSVELLTACQLPPGVEEPRIDLEWDVVTAFQEGRHLERRHQECRAARRAFLEAWPDLEERIRSIRGKKK